MKLVGRRLVRSFLTLSIGVAVAPSAAAEEPPLHAGRLEFDAVSAYSFTPASISRFALGAALDYYLTDALAIGTEGQVWLADSAPPPMASLWPLQQKLWSGSLDFTYVPLSTARGVRDPSSLDLDGYVLAGIGAIGTRQIPVIDPTRILDPKVALDVDVGAGARVFFARSFAVSFGVRDLIYSETPESKTIAAQPRDPTTFYGGSRLVNDVQATVGLSTWFPMR